MELGDFGKCVTDNCNEISVTAENFQAIAYSLSRIGLKDLSAEIGREVGVLIAASEAIDLSTRVRIAAEARRNEQTALELLSEVLSR